MSQQRIDQFLKRINSLNYHNVKGVLQATYTEDVKFVDPVKTINSLDELTKYFENLYKRVNKCHFILNNYLPNSHSHSLEWVMHLQHQKISKNQEIHLSGASFIQFDGERVCYHRDYYDLGALVYEHIPILGSVIKKVRHAI
jgi:hypothetical protein